VIKAKSLSGGDMPSEIKGWCGRILKIDLSTHGISELETMAYAGRFLGGRGIATRVYWEEVQPEVGAYDPRNCLILMTGPLGATGAQGASRLVVAGKSPMTLPEGFCYGNLGGYFGPSLKMAGYDGIVVTGRAERPSCISIHDGKTEILAATELWGKGTYEVQGILREKYGKRVHFLATGLAGENRCRIATIQTDLEGSATCGFGAVMGSKNLKAIAVVGTKRVAVARHGDLIELNRRAISLSKRGLLRMPLPKKQIQYVKKASCYQCGLDCLRGVFRTASGKEAVRKCQSMVFYVPWVLDAPGEPIETALDATHLCNDLSLCTMEMGNLISWLHQCLESGYLTEKETGLEFSKVGTREFLERLVTMIALRKGFGDVLAEGILRAQQVLGNKAPKFFLENISGVGEETAYSPRLYIVNALLYALEPRQHMALLHEVSYMIARWLLHRIRPDLSPTTGEVFRAAATKFWGHAKAWNMSTYEGKAVAAAKIQDRTYTKDSLVLCENAWPIMDSFNTPDHLGDSSLESKLFTAATGIETGEAELNVYGERIFNQQRAVLLREGWRPIVDDSPAEVNFTDPLKYGFLNPHLIVPGPGEEALSMEGNMLDRDKFARMRAEFYQLRGWDPQTGLQKTHTLQRLDLDDLVKALRTRDLLIQKDPDIRRTT
jgi:aldehyde:ferredoxin oxidoreductase